MFLLLFHALNADGNSKGAIQGAKWKPLCTLTADANKVYNRALKLQTLITDYTKAATKLAVEAVAAAQKMQNAEAHAAAIGLVAEIREQLKSKQPEIARCYKVAVETPAFIGYTHGRIAELLAIMGHNRGASNYGYLAQLSSPTSPATDAATAQLSSCKIKPHDITEGPEETEVLTKKGFVGMDHGTGLVDGVLTSSCNEHCVLTSATATALNSDTGPQEDIPFTNGYILKHQTNTARSSQLINSLSKQAKGLPNKGQNQQYVRLWDKYVQLEGCETSFKAGFSRPEAQTLKQSVAVLTALKNIIDNESGEYDLSKDGEKIKTVAEKLFKPGEDNYPEKLYKEAQAKTLRKTLMAGNTATSLTNLETPIDLQIAQMYYTQRKIDGFIAKLKEAEEQLSKDKLGDYGAAAAEDACNKLDGEQKCNTDKKCSYETASDGTNKCTYNASKAKANNVPVALTQTESAKKTTKKCKGKKKDDCKSPDCKWEGETCKDFSFLVNTKSTLMAATFLSFFKIFHPLFPC
uniref:Variant surface glycoprotein 1125.232 n=2 Tax=Trypanosoma brucei TaxID=5691 RepID=A0A1J0R5E1_9TRYP|nr:variant surface glycoprotein 1125.232 [Trypanosoma brucei]